MLLVHISTALLFQLPSVFAQCYYYNGTINTRSGYRTCSASASSPLSKICCAVWDRCLDNGLCLNTNEGGYWRETCTLPNWNSGGCLDICTSGDGAGQDVLVTPCDMTASSPTWCCGNSTACCTDGSGLPRYTIARVLGEALTTSSSSSSSLARSTTTISTPSSIPAAASSTPSASPPAASNTPAGGLSTGAKAGIGVGAALGVLALIALGVLIGKKTRRAHTQTALGHEAAHNQMGYEPPKYAQTVQQGTPYVHGHAQDASRPMELPGSHAYPTEMSPERAK